MLTPGIERFHEAVSGAGSPIQAYCDLLEVRWLLSEEAGHDVGDGGRSTAAAEEHEQRHGHRDEGRGGEQVPRLTERAADLDQLGDDRPVLDPPYTRPISRSFQINMNWKIASDASAGTESGSTKRRTR